MARRTTAEASGAGRAALRPLLLVVVVQAIAQSARTQAMSIDAGVIAGSDTTTISDPEGQGYGKPNQSRLWYNSYQQRWDALVPRNAGPSSGSDHFILEDVTGSQVFTSVALEDRDSARPDALWLDSSRRLYVLGSHGSATRFWKVDYDATTDRYSIDPHVAGVVVPGLVHGAALGENRPASLYVTPNGRVWAAVMREGALEVQISDDAGRHWLRSPVRLDAHVRVGVTTWSGFTTGGTPRAGLFAAENGDEGRTRTRFYYRHIAQGADPTLLASWVDESAALPAPEGLETSDDHAHGTNDAAGNQYFVVKTESGRPLAPRIRLFRRTPAGVWSAYTVTRARDLPEQTRPSVVVDDMHGQLYVYSTQTGGGEARRVTASLDDLARLDTNPPVVVLSRPGQRFDDVNAPRQSLTRVSGTVVLAHDETAKNVWFAADAIAQDFCMHEEGGTPELLDVTLTQIDGGGILPARVWRPDPELQRAPCPLVALLPRSGGAIAEMDWAAERLAASGYVVIVVDAAQDTIGAFDRALRSAIDFGVSSANPWAAATDGSRVGAIAGPFAASALTRSQLLDERIDVIVAWDNLAKHENGDWGSPNCFQLPTLFRHPRVPAMGLASDRCLKLFEARKTAYQWWRANGVPAMEVVFENSSPKWWGPAASAERHDWIHYYTSGWLDRWLKDDTSASERLVAREVLGTALETLLDSWYRSAVFLDGQECSDLRAGCSH